MRFNSNVACFYHVRFKALQTNDISICIHILSCKFQKFQRTNSPEYKNFLCFIFLYPIYILGDVNQLYLWLNSCIYVYIRSHLVGSLFSSLSDLRLSIFKMAGIISQL